MRVTYHLLYPTDCWILLGSSTSGTILVPTALKPPIQTGWWSWMSQWHENLENLQGTKH
jgi:hypothetical protein